MTTVDAHFRRGDLALHLGGGLFGDGSRAFAAFRRAVDAGQDLGSYDQCTARGVVPGSFVLDVLRQADRVDVWSGGVRRPLTGAEAADAVGDGDGPWTFSVVEF